MQAHQAVMPHVSVAGATLANIPTAVQVSSSSVGAKRAAESTADAAKRARKKYKTNKPKSASGAGGEVFDDAYYAAKTWKSKGPQFKSGRWSKKESEILQKQMSEYIEEHDIDKTHLLGVKKQDIRGAWIVISQCLPKRTVYSCYYHGQRIISGSAKRVKWTEQAVNDLRVKVEKYGRKWVKIGEELGRYSTSCRDKYRELEKPSKRMPWKAEDDAKLRRLVMANHEDPEVMNKRRHMPAMKVQWSKVIKAMPDGRSRGECRARYYNVLQPASVKEKTTPRRGSIGGAKDKARAAAGDGRGAGSGWTPAQELAFIKAVEATGAQDESEVPWETLTSEKGTTATASAKASVAAKVNSSTGVVVEPVAKLPFWRQHAARYLRSIVFKRLQKRLVRNASKMRFDAVVRAVRESLEGNASKGGGSGGNHMIESTHSAVKVKGTNLRQMPGGHKPPIAVVPLTQNGMSR